MSQYPHQPLDQLRDIHRMMERTSKFIGLSGLSGVGAGIFALIGAIMAHWYLVAGGLDGYGPSLRYWPNQPHPWGWSPLTFYILDAGFVLAGALTSGIYFTTRRAHRKGQAIWDALTQRLLLHLAIPLVTGGIFCLALFFHGYLGLVGPATLIFYGLALVNGSKFTLQDVYYLGLCEIALGCIGVFFIGWGLLLWAIGFGALHIVYGIMMYLKYEQGT
ncbi:hypothetical protein [Lewinella cohaerens]|uniref:hypothetical protein n=1 Tax=Lewinella cohaerens TaxID=70995 RepID=UPI00035C7144|nr:hypothetical protein [Lewinella cohaerens]